MSAIAIVMNLLLAGLLVAALTLGMRLNRRLKALRDSQDGFATAVAELNAAAARAEQGLADLRAATDEATDELADRIEKGRALAAKLERLVAQAPEQVRAAPEPASELGRDAARDAERRLGALLAAAREARAKPERLVRPEPRAVPRPASPDDDLFEDAPLTLDSFGGRR
jgi:ABC-type transporter Mla subunit MlaD